MKKVVIIGGGFAGLSAAKQLVKSAELEIILIDQKNYHLFQPLLYQVATAGLNPGDIAVSFRSIFGSKDHLKILHSKVDSIDLENKIITGQDLDQEYDYLIVSMGSETSYFGNSNWAKHCFELKSIDDAIHLRNELLTICEQAEIHSLKSIKVAIIGGGPTGVELAGSIAEFFRYTAKNQFEDFRPDQSQVTVIEQASRILSYLPENLSGKAESQLEKLGVNLQLNCTVKDIAQNTISWGEDESQFDMIIWTAGVQPACINSSKVLSRAKNKKYIVSEDLSLSENSNVFVLGDQSSFAQKSFPSLAPLAIQQGSVCAKNILRDLKGEPREAFSYKDKGTLAVVGRGFAVAKVGGLETSGLLAWLIWCFIHILPLVGFRNKFLVFFEFIWSFFNYKRGVRIITEQRLDKDVNS